MAREVSPVKGVVMGFRSELAEEFSLAVGRHGWSTLADDLQQPGFQARGGFQRMDTLGPSLLTLGVAPVLVGVDHHGDVVPCLTLALRYPDRRLQDTITTLAVVILDLQRDPGALLVTEVGLAQVLQQHFLGIAFADDQQCAFDVACRSAFSHGGHTCGTAP